MKTVYFWGFNWDIRSFIRTSAFHQAFPSLMRMVKMFWPPLKTYPNSPSVLHVFDNKIVDISVGGGHVLFLDGTNKTNFRKRKVLWGRR